MPDLSFREYPAPPALATWLAASWCFRAAPDAAETMHAVIPDGCISIVAVRAPARLPARVMGPFAVVLPVPIAPGACIFGVRLQPAAGASVLGVEPAALRDRLLPLADVSPSVQAALAPALASAEEVPLGALEAAFATLLASAPPVDAGIAEALRAVAGARGLLTVAQAAACAGVAVRQFQRRFRAAVGLTFKEYARICRFRAAAAELLRDGTPLARLAALRGYADQSHLVRESARLSGLSPRALRAYLAGIEHTLLP